MRIGIITDIHEHVDLLARALEHLVDVDIDQIVVIGDLFETGERIDEVCRLLAEANAVGVWGNHDYGLCREVDPETRARYSDGVLKYMGSLKPHLEIAGCHFMHIEPWLDPHRLEDLWYHGVPNSPESLHRIFDRTTQQWMFGGHYHTWLLASPFVIHPWHGQSPVSLADDRYFVVVGALFDGNFAIMDTDARVLTPHWL